MRFTHFFFLLFLVITAAYGQQERVAIINTVDDRDSIGFSELSYLTDRLRETAANILPKPQYGVMTTESIVAFLSSQENAIKVCNESSCLAEVGRKVNVDYVAQGRIGRFEGDLTIKVELYNTKSGVMVGSFTGDSKSLQGLRVIIDENAPILFKKMLLLVVEDEKNKPKLEIAEPYVPKPEVEKPLKTSFWVALGLDVLGVAFISYAIFENGEMVKYRDKYHETGRPQSYYDDAYKKAEDHRSSRNMFYVIGGVALASGIGVHIWF